MIPSGFRRITAAHTIQIITVAYFKRSCRCQKCLASVIYITMSFSEFPNTLVEYKLKLEKLLTNSIQLMIILCQAFGAAPVNLTLSPLPLISKKLNKNFSAEKKTLLSRWLHYVWSGTLLSAITAAIYLQHRDFDSGELTAVTRILYLVEYFFNFLSSAIVMIGSNYQSKWYGIYYHQIINFDIRLERCGFTDEAYFSNLKQYLRKVLALTAVLFLAVFIVDLLFNRVQFIDTIRSETVYVLPNAIQLLALIEYITLLHAVRERYKQINCILDKLLNHQLNRSSEIRDTSVISLMEITKKNAYCRFVSFEELLNNLRRLHRDLNAFETNVNQSFGILLISIITSSFIIVNTQLYALYTMTKLKFEDINPFLVIYTLIWLILHSGKTIFVLLLNTNVTEEVIVCIFLSDLFITYIFVCAGSRNIHVYEERN